MVEKFSIGSSGDIVFEFNGNTCTVKLNSRKIEALQASIYSEVQISRNDAEHILASLYKMADGELLYSKYWNYSCNNETNFGIVAAWLDSTHKTSIYIEAYEDGVASADVTVSKETLKDCIGVNCYQFRNHILLKSPGDEHTRISLDRDKEGDYYRITYINNERLICPNCGNGILYPNMHKAHKASGVDGSTDFEYICGGTRRVFNGIKLNLKGYELIECNDSDAYWDLIWPKYIKENPDNEES